MAAVADDDFVMICNDRFRVYRDGRVYSEAKRRLLPRQGANNNKVTIYRDGKYKYVSVQNLVYRAFVEDVDISEKLVVRHKDGNPQNCHVDNLYLPGTIVHEVIQRALLNFPRPGHIQARPPFTRYVACWQGFVYNAMSGATIKGTDTPDGYVAFSALDDAGAYVSMLMHRFVHWCFYPDFDINDPERLIDHRDHNRKNNNIFNLFDVDSVGNAVNRTARPADGKYHKAIEVMKNGEVVETLDSGIQVLEKYSVTRSNITLSVRKLQVFKGVTFRFYFEDLANETWVKIIQCELAEWAPAGITDLVGIYVSSLGRIMGPSGILSRTTAKGMANRTIIFHGRKSTRAHQVICYAFHGPPGEDETVDHRNKDHQDNRAVNLRWATQEEQVANKTTIRPIMRTCVNTGETMTFPTKVKAAKFAGVKCGLTITQYCDSGKTLAGGTWSYAPEKVVEDLDGVLTGDPRCSVPVPYEHVRLICQHGGEAILDRLGLNV